MSTADPTSSRASSARRRPPTPHTSANININLDPDSDEGESGETEIAHTFLDADTARTDISLPQDDPSIEITLRSSLPVFGTTTGSLLPPIEGIDPLEETRPTPKKTATPNPTKKLTSWSNDQEETVVRNVLSKLGKFIGTSLIRVADASGMPIPTNPPQELLPFLQEEDPSITLTDIWKEFMTTRTLVLKKDQQYAGFSKSLTRLWVRRNVYELIPWPETLANYKNLSESEVSDWIDKDIFYPAPIAAIMESSNPEIRNDFRREVREALRKWRTPGDSFSRIYPTTKDWKEGIAFNIMDQGDYNAFELWKPLTFNVVRGIGDDGNHITKYFIIDHFVGGFRQTLQARRSTMSTPPFFPLPQYGVSQRLLRGGLSEEEARQAAAIFRVETEACLLEIWSKLCPTMSDKTFRMNSDSIRNMSMPFWTEELLQTVNQQNPSDYAHIRDTPPHLTTRKKHTTFDVPDNDAVRWTDYNDHDIQKAYEPDNSTRSNRHNSNSRNLRATIAAKHVGTRPIVTDRGSHLGQGRLRDSIMGPHYVRDSSNELPRISNSPGFAMKNETPEIRLNSDSIFIDELPGSQNSQHEDENENNYYGPPGGDPNDPDDDDDGPPGRGPPGGGPPGGGPPRGPPGDYDPWRFRGPGGPYGPPGGGPPGGGPPGGPPGGGPPGNNRNPNRLPVDAFGINDGFKFEKKIKISDVPEWDGNGDTILEWLDKLNHISYRNQNIYYDLGIIAPLRLTDSALRWFHALAPNIQRHIQQNWGEFKLAISTYFMNQQWFDRMKSRVLRMRYRQKDHEHEMPSDYFHRKLRMIQEVFDQTQSETIMEIMNGAPRYWSILIDTSRVNTIQDLQYYIKYHEEQLVRNPDTQAQEFDKRLKALEGRPNRRSARFAQTNEAEAEVNFVRKRPFKKKLVGAHAKFSSYQFPQNDQVISKGKTPEEKGARPCRHCGSGKHWDFDHPFSGKGDRKAKAFLAKLDTEALEAYVAYEKCYLESGSEEDTNLLTPTEEQEDPCEFSDDEDFPHSLA